MRNKIIQYSLILFARNYSISPPLNYHYLPILQIYPWGMFVGLTHLFCGTPGLIFLPEVHNSFLPILLPLLQRNDHWSPLIHGERNFGPEKYTFISESQSVWAIYWLKEYVFQYQIIFKSLSSTITTCIYISVWKG